MKFASTKKPSQARLFNLFNPSPEPPASIGVCDFMKLLDDLHKRYVTPLQQEFNFYFIGGMYLGHSVFQDGGAYTFSDGVKVKSMNYLKRMVVERNRRLAAVFVSIAPETQRVRVVIEDYRFTPGLTRSKVAQRFLQEVEVPHEFYQFLYEQCIESCNLPLDIFKDFLTYELAQTNQQLHIFDRPAKLRALRDLLAA